MPRAISVTLLRPTLTHEEVSPAGVWKTHAHGWSWEAEGRTLSTGQLSGGSRGAPWASGAGNSGNSGAAPAAQPQSHLKAPFGNILLLLPFVLLVREFLPLLFQLQSWEPLACPQADH